ncbi:MAG: hypothetical protein J7L78_02065 [Dehalococcoidales bacterium]|nr:hypothetical protein [Dehalococcoidales bacterium]
MSSELVSLISDIAIGASAIFVAVMAFLGLQTWRKELTGKAEFDLAHNLMLTGFKLKAHFEDARNPFTYSTESAGRSRQEDETPNVSQVLDEWYARASRLKPLQEDLIKIQEASWEAQILLSEDSSKSISEAVTAYRRSFGELSSAIYSYFEERRREVVSRGANIDHTWLKELHQTIYSPTGDNISKQIDKATAKLESTLQAYVK